MLIVFNGSKFFLKISRIECLRKKINNVLLSLLNQKNQNEIIKEKENCYLKMKFTGPQIKQNETLLNICNQVELVTHTPLKSMSNANSLGFKRSTLFSVCFCLGQTCSK